MEKSQYEKLKLIREIQAAGRSLLKQNHGSDIRFTGYGRQEKKVAAEITHKVNKKKPCAAYDKDGVCIDRSSRQRG